MAEVVFAVPVLPGKEELDRQVMDVAIVYFEADDAEAPMRWTQSDSAVSQWFVEQMREVHGIDISQQPPPPVSKVHDVRV